MDSRQHQQHHHQQPLPPHPQQQPPQQQPPPIGVPFTRNAGASPPYGRSPFPHGPNPATTPSPYPPASHPQAHPPRRVLQVRLPLHMSTSISDIPQTPPSLRINRRDRPMPLSTRRILHTRTRDTRVPPQ
ncbi:U6 snRNA-associated Sm-like protein LSm5 [Apiospora arundinis]